MIGLARTKITPGFPITNMAILVITSVYKATTKSEFLDFWNSLLSQTFQDFSLCLYIDGPISKELEMCITGCQHNSHFPVEVIKSSLNTGLSKALNSMIIWGLRQESNVFIRADSDDRFPPNRFQTLIEFLYQNPNIDAVGSNYSYFGIRKGNSSLPTTNHQIKHKFSYAVAIGHATVAFRDTFFEKSGFYEQGFTNKIEDQRLWAAAFRNGCKLANVGDVLYEVRVTKGMLLRRASISEKTELFFIRLRHILTQIRPVSQPLYLTFAFFSYLLSITLILALIPLKIYYSFNFLNQSN